MRSRDLIYQDLYSKLSTSTWLKLRDSLVGQELLNFGVEVISAVEARNDAYLANQSYRTADLPNLYRLAGENFFAVSNISPGTIRVNLPSGNTIYKPYELKVVLGNNTFYNVEYVKLGDSVNLYQGTPLGFYGSAAAPSFCPFYEEIESWTGTNLGSTKLLDNALPESVFVYNPALLPRYVPTQSGSECMSYKLVTAADGKLRVYFGDNTWSAEYPTASVVLCYLSLSLDEFSVGNQVSVYAHGGEFNAEVTYVSQPEYSLDYARGSYIKNLFESSALITPQDIREYINSHVEVVDCSVYPNGSTYEVRLKPHKGDYEYFGLLRDKLNDLTPITYNLNIALGRQVDVTLVLKGEITDGSKSQINTYLEDKYDYEKTPFDLALIPYDIQNDINSRFQVSIQCFVKVSKTITSAVSSFTEQFLPLRGSLEFYDNSGTLRGFDDSLGNIIFYSDSEVKRGVHTDNIFGNCALYRDENFNWFVKDITSLSRVNVTDALQSLQPGVIDNIRILSSLTNPILYIEYGSGWHYIFVLKNTNWWYHPTAIDVFDVLFSGSITSDIESWHFNNLRYPQGNSGTGTEWASSSCQSRIFRPRSVVVGNKLICVVPYVSSSGSVYSDYFIDIYTTDSSGRIKLINSTEMYLLGGVQSVALSQGSLYVFSYKGEGHCFTNVGSPLFDPSDSAYYQKFSCDFIDVPSDWNFQISPYYSIALSNDGRVSLSLVSVSHNKPENYNTDFVSGLRDWEDIPTSLRKYFGSTCELYYGTGIYLSGETLKVNNLRKISEVSMFCPISMYRLPGSEVGVPPHFGITTAGFAREDALWFRNISIDSLTYNDYIGSDYDGTVDFICSLPEEASTPIINWAEYYKLHNDELVWDITYPFYPTRQVSVAGSVDYNLGDVSIWFSTSGAPYTMNYFASSAKTSSPDSYIVVKSVEWE